MNSIHSRDPLWLKPLYFHPHFIIFGMNYTGIDCLQQYSHIALTDEEGKILKSGR
jgi:hypothetical protein